MEKTLLLRFIEKNLKLFAKNHPTTWLNLQAMENAYQG
jgi:hypothetical protein